MIRRGFTVICFGFLVLGGLLSPAWALITIDNGIIGDGRWEIDVLDAGDVDENDTWPGGATWEGGRIDPVGPIGLTDVVWDFITFVDVDIDGNGFMLRNSTTTGHHLTGTAEVTSSGSFAGPNGIIFWEAVASIPQGTQDYEVKLTFTAEETSTFGNVRIISYFDGDVDFDDADDDLLVSQGTSGGADFSLLTVDPDWVAGVAQMAAYTTATGTTYVGWAADEYKDLANAITGPGAVYSLAGQVDTTALPPTTDPRFPAESAWGPGDITSAIAFDLNSNASDAEVTFILRGLSNIQMTTGEVPSMNAWGMGIFALLLGLMTVRHLRRRLT